MAQKFPFIEIKNLSKNYNPNTHLIKALQDVSLSIETQDIYGIIGTSGAGKSTLIRCLATLVEPSSGEIFFQGTQMTHLRGDALRKLRFSIGMIFQHFNLFSSRTVEGNISFPLEVEGMRKLDRERRVDELLTLVGLSEKKQASPARLSGGEKQRVGIARALAGRPSLLLCDEATSALDPKTTQEILDLLKSIHKKMGITIVLITHDMDVIRRICNRVAILEAGRIVEKGLVSKVFADPQHPKTKQFIQNACHEIPAEFFKPLSPHRKLLRLRFTGKAAGEPLISHIIQKFGIEANILLGWIDKLQTSVVGTLIVEMTGSPEGMNDSLSYLSEQDVHWEVLLGP